MKTTVATAEQGLADLSTYVQAQIGPEGSLTSAVNQKMTAEVNSDGTAKASYTLNMGIVRNGVKYNTGFGMSIEPSGNSYKSTVVFAANSSAFIPVMIPATGRLHFSSITDRYLSVMR